jgi:uncharacterized membrane protein
MINPTKKVRRIKKKKREDLDMKRLVALVSCVVLFLSLLLPINSEAAEGVTLYTPLSGISLTPGESQSYTVDVINDSSTVKTLDLRVEGLPENWVSSITADGFELQQLSVKPNSEENFTLNVEVPLQVEKGSYDFTVIAEENGVETSLPISVTVAETGVFKTELVTDQINMEGDSDATFSYDVELKNHTAEEQHYALQANAPRGWQVNFKAGGKDVTSVTVGSNQTENISVDITPSKQAKKGEYEIPIIATSGQTKSELSLEAVITGTYSIELTTPDGRVSTDINAGSSKTISLHVTNNGTTDLKDISLSGSTPPNWEIEFSPKDISKLEAGKTEVVKATLTATDKAIAGDYVVEMSAKSPEVSSEKAFRISVKTSLLWGWVGIGIILLVVVGIFFLVKKYGRR